MKRFFSFLSLLMIICVMLQAQENSTPRISLITVGPGDTYYLLEGHTGLRINYDDGRDYVVNWGVFDFSKPNFGYRFVKGETDYSIGLEPTNRFLDHYIADDRTIEEQTLNLNSHETEELLRLIDINLRPENRVYRYNYVRDNCATRPLNLIERALNSDGAVLEIASDGEEPSSFRGEMRKYHVFNPGYQLFIDMVLGLELDSIITTRQKAFAPVYFSKLTSTASILDADGSHRPLSLRKTTLHQREKKPYKEPFLNPLWIVTVILAFAIWLNFRDAKRGRVSLWFDACFFSLLGLIGLLLTFLIFVSTHEATTLNLNYLWINPGCLLVPILIPFRRCKRAIYYYQWINLGLIIIFLVTLPLDLQASSATIILLLLTDFLRAENYITIHRRNGFH